MPVGPHHTGLGLNLSFAHDVHKLTHTCSQKLIVNISSQLQVQYCHVGSLKFHGSIYTTEIGKHHKWRLFCLES